MVHHRWNRPPLLLRLVDTEADDDADCQRDGKEYESAAESVLISFAEIDTRIAHFIHDASATE